MNIGQRPLSVGEEETHMSPSIVTRDNNRYTLFMHCHIYTRLSIFRPNMLFKVYDNILSRFTYKKPCFINLSSSQEGTSIFDVVRLNAQTKNLATLKMVCWDLLIIRLSKWLLLSRAFALSGKYLFLKKTYTGHSSKKCISSTQNGHATLRAVGEKRCWWTLIWDTPILNWAKAFLYTSIQRKSTYFPLSKQFL